MGRQAFTRWGVAARPFERLHPAHRTAGHCQQLVDAQVIEQVCLRSRHIPDSKHRKIQAVGFACFGVDRARAGRTLAASDHVGTDDEELIGVEGFARADAVVPPTGGLVGKGVVTSQVRVSRQGMLDQDGVAALGVERAVGFIRQRDRPQCLAAVEGHGLIFGEGEELFLDDAGRVGHGNIRGNWVIAMPDPDPTGYHQYPPARCLNAQSRG